MNINVLHIFPLPPIRSGVTDYAKVFEKALSTNVRISIDPFEDICQSDIIRSGFMAIWALRNKVTKLVKSHRFDRYDVVWVELGRHTAFELVLAYIISIYVPGVLLVATIHDPPSLVRSVVKHFRFPLIRRTSRFRSATDRFLQKHFIKRCSMIFVFSVRGKEAFTDLFPFAKRKLHRIPHVAYDTSEAIQVTKNALLQVEARFDTINFKTVGIFGTNKGHDILFQAFRLFLDQHKRDKGDSKLIVGGGSGNENMDKASLTKLKQLASKLGISEYLKFVGYLSPENDLPEFLFTRDIFIVPYSKTFNYSTSGNLMRMLTAGAAVIVTDVNTLSEVVKHGENGFVVQPGDPHDLADKMAQLYDNLSLRCSLVKNAIDYIWENHRWELVEEKVWGLLYELFRTDRC